MCGILSIVGGGSSRRPGGTGRTTRSESRRPRPRQQAGRAPPDIIFPTTLPPDLGLEREFIPIPEDLQLEACNQAKYGDPVGPHAVMALGRLRPHGVRPAIERLLDHPQPLVRR